MRSAYIMICVIFALGIAGMGILFLGETASSAIPEVDSGLGVPSGITDLMGNSITYITIAFVFALFIAILTEGMRMEGRQ